MKINLGCGGDIKEGWENIDQYFQADKSVKKMDARNLDYENDSAEEIYAAHLLEHIPYEQTLITLREWYRVLAPEGKITVIVPDLDMNCKNWLGKGPEKYLKDILKAFYGSQSREGQFHHAGFNFETLRDVMSEAGFKNIKETTRDHPNHLWVVATK